MSEDQASRVFRLDGEVALITGGGSGLGLAVAQCMAAAGARVVVVGRREAPLAEACAAIGPSASYEVADITEFDKVEALVARVRERVGPISILVNNAGVHLKKWAVDTTVEAFAEVMNTHVLAAHNLTRHVLPGMIAARHGSVLFTASMTSLIGMTQVIAYSAAKSAYLGMVRALSSEVAEHGVRVNAVAPGWIESPMLRKALAGDEKRTAKILSRTPMGRFGEPDDIGWAAVFLSSPAARFVTGVLLPVDGGASQGF
ncbi:SDR family oxidoreductase [Siculibacillus lacustris]|uniref:SDR family oxidoreductase n=1 Tax=Siculibacillus lacustris TaxID=1549641 RepID=A0A4Q9VPT6_9HYPH|nr:SDR family NAD(P)-dependent oxidoreductase [Siculibacillus lacustris]TBW37639.1 SDR family oxidoreductase [Siculibacillus lacustris]